jgi:hypothetical protein
MASRVITAPTTIRVAVTCPMNPARTIDGPITSPPRHHQMRVFRLIPARYSTELFGDRRRQPCAMTAAGNPSTASEDAHVALATSVHADVPLGRGGV